MRLWKIALAFIAPLAIAPVVADSAGPREHHGAWQQEPIVLSLRLGTEAGDLKIIPSKLTLQAETPYKLVIINPSEVAHVLALPEFSAAVEHSSVPAFPYKPAEIDVAVDLVFPDQLVAMAVVGQVRSRRPWVVARLPCDVGDVHLSAVQAGKYAQIKPQPRAGVGNVGDADITLGVGTPRGQAKVVRAGELCSVGWHIGSGCTAVNRRC